MRSVVIALGALAFAAAAVAPASAQPFGTFSWQLLPYCNVLTLTVTQTGGLFTMTGTDDQCGGSAARASVSGLAFLNPSGTIGMGLTIVTPTAGAPVPVHLDVSVSVTSVSGTWRDSAGHSGDFFFTPNRVPGGSPRPLSASGLPPGSVTTTELAPAAVGAAQLAPGAVTTAAIADASITAAKIADRPRASFTGLSLVQIPETGANTVIGTLSLTAPAAGRVVVTASLTLNFEPGVVFNSVFADCWVATDPAAVSSGASVLEDGFDDEQNRPLALTRGFDVAAGPVEFNVVCRALLIPVRSLGGHMTAQFFPVP